MATEQAINEVGDAIADLENHGYSHERVAELLRHVAQLRAGHALLVRLGEALDFDRDAQLMKEDQGDTDWGSVARAIAMVREARLDVDAHALSLVASPAQAVKL